MFASPGSDCKNLSRREKRRLVREILVEYEKDIRQEWLEKLIAEIFGKQITTLNTNCV